VSRLPYAYALSYMRCITLILINDSTSPAMDQSRPEPSSPVQEISGLGSDRFQMLTDWTGLGPDQSLTVSRVRVYFPGY